MLTICSKIVVPFDNSDLSKKALETALTLAKQDERIEINVITVVDMMKFPSLHYTSVPIREALITTAKEFLHDVEENLKTIPNKTKTFILEGSSAVTIEDFIKENNADLVIMGSRGLSGVKEVFLGSVSHHVVQKSPCPVYIIK